MEQLRFLRQLVWIVAAVSALLLAASGWSRQRLRTAGIEINALTSETVDLAERNARLQRQLDAQATLRENLRSAGQPVVLRATTSNVNARATVHIDRMNHRALVSIDHLSTDDSHTYRLVVSSPAGKHVISFEPSPSGSTELLLEDLPPDLESVSIERLQGSTDRTEEVILSAAIDR